MNSASSFFSKKTSAFNRFNFGENRSGCYELRKLSSSHLMSFLSELICDRSVFAMHNQNFAGFCNLLHTGVKGIIVAIIQINLQILVASSAEECFVINDTLLILLAYSAIEVLWFQATSLTNINLELSVGFFKHCFK